MEHFQKHEVEPTRAALIYNHFEKSRNRIISGELEIGEHEGTLLEIGDPYDVSMRASLGYLQDSKYVIYLEWCLLQTLTHGEIERFIARIEQTKDDGGLVNRLIVEHCDGEIRGMFYSKPVFHPLEFHPNEIVLHLIMKDLAEYPSVHCCED